MKILEPGNPDAVNKSLGGRCRQCGCLVECERAEAQWVELGGDGRYVVACPCCGDKGLLLDWRD